MMKTMRTIYSGSGSIFTRRTLGTKRIYFSSQSYDTKELLSPMETILNGTVNLVSFPLHLLGNGFIQVDSNYRTVLTKFGKFSDIKGPGCHWIYDPIFTKKNDVFMGVRTFELEECKIIDKDGRPIQIAGMINYQVEKPQLFVLNSEDSHTYICNQSRSIFKRIVSNYTYNMLCNDLTILDHMVKLLQEFTKDVGVKINNIQITELKYSAEMASSLLLKQQALSYIEAKQEIGDASILIVKDIINKLESELQMKLSIESKEKLITNLLVVIASGNTPQQTMSL